MTDRTPTRSQPPPQMQSAKTDPIASRPNRTTRRTAKTLRNEHTTLTVRFSTPSTEERRVFNTLVTAQRAVIAGARVAASTISREYLRGVSACAQWILRGELPPFSVERIAYGLALVGDILDSMETPSNTVTNSESKLTASERAVMRVTLVNLTNNEAARTAIKNALEGVEFPTNASRNNSTMLARVDCVRATFPNAIRKGMGLGDDKLDAFASRYASANEMADLRRNRASVKSHTRHANMETVGRLALELRALTSVLRARRKIDPRTPRFETKVSHANKAPKKTLAKLVQARVPASMVQTTIAPTMIPESSPANE
jgi:hypothetical protein